MPCLFFMKDTACAGCDTPPQTEVVTSSSASHLHPCARQPQMEPNSEVGEEGGGGNPNPLGSVRAMLSSPCLRTVKSSSRHLKDNYRIKQKCRFTVVQRAVLLKMTGVFIGGCLQASYVPRLSHLMKRGLAQRVKPVVLPLMTKYS